MFALLRHRIALHSSRTSRVLRAAAGLAVLIACTMTLLSTSLVDPDAARAEPAALGPAVEKGDWPWPLPGNPQVSRRFVAPASPWGAGHRGIDVRTSVGTSVRAVHAGRVHFAGMVVDRSVVTIEHVGGVLISYEAITPAVEEGERVEAGDLVGHVSAGPHCGTSCLHIGLRIDHSYRNPLLLFGEVERAVLLPMR